MGVRLQSENVACVGGDQGTNVWGQNSNGRRVMLNDVLAGCVGAALVVVFAAIFGVVELLGKGLQAARRVSGL